MIILTSIRFSFLNDNPRNESIFLVKKLSFLKMKGPPPTSSWGTCESQDVCSDSLGVSALRSSASPHRQNKTSKTDRGRKWDVSSTGFVWDKQGDIMWLVEHKAKEKQPLLFDLFLYCSFIDWTVCDGCSHGHAGVVKEQVEGQEQPAACESCRGTKLLSHISANRDTELRVGNQLCRD